MNITIKVTPTTAEQLVLAKTSARFFSVDGTSVTASRETWEALAGQSDAVSYTALPKCLSNVWSRLGVPQQRNMATRAAKAVK